MTQTNFLIGRGELLTYDILPPGGGGSKNEVYTLDEARSRLIPQMQATAEAFSSLPFEACPKEFVVARVAMNPSFIAKSFFPTGLLRSNDLLSVGSRTIQLIPDKWSKKEVPRLCSTTELFVAGTRNNFSNLYRWAQNVSINDLAARDLVRVEQFAEFKAADRLRKYDVGNQRFFEVGVHLLPNQDSDFIKLAFQTYAEKLGIKVHVQLSFQAGNLWFVPVEGGSDSINDFAHFSFIRVLRPVPVFRGLRPVSRSTSLSISCRLPTEQPLSSEPRVAILDGGLPKHHPLDSHTLISYKVLDPSAQDDRAGLEHGLAVTSAFLFGPITPNGMAQRPYAPVDHVRVLDDDSQTEDPLELYRTLGHIEQVLLSRQYEFLNLSLGPDLPIEDADVHAWTSVIDDLLSDGETFMTVAAGNNGERDKDSGNARIQVPADSVNAVAVGSADDIATGWSRAGYSAIGPGRRPGVVKPDLLAFGGEASKRYFHVLQPGKQPVLTPQQGTSFASPLLLRTAVGVRAVLGREMTPLAIKALLVHSADQAGHDKINVGWGKVPENLMDIITSPAGVARVVYQGELKPGKYLRASIPIPKAGLQGRIRLKATFCYASPVDPQDASTYTRAGLEITFRPDMANIKKSKKTGKPKANAETAGFFDMKKYATEEERRSDWGKWETTLHAEVSKQGISLNGPAFDIHYNAREAGASTPGADKIKYALVITIEATKHQDLYNEIIQSYASVLVPIQPKVSIPIQV
jgi:Subtilase family